MASKGINKVILIGHLGQDPEVRHMPDGRVVANISIATSESWRDKRTNEIKEKTEWHRVVMFGKPAEIAGEYLRKGAQAYIEGSLQTRKWQDQNGQERYTTEVVVNPISGVMQMLGGRQGNEERAVHTQKNAPPNANGILSSPPSNIKQQSEPPMDFDDEEIPF